jgi:hypothetical protein
MATAAVQLPTSIHHGLGTHSAQPESNLKTHDVPTTLYYYKDPGDGSPPAPTIVG